MVFHFGDGVLATAKPQNGQKDSVDFKKGSIHSLPVLGNVWLMALLAQRIDVHVVVAHRIGRGDDISVTDIRTLINVILAAIIQSAIVRFLLNISKRNVIKGNKVLFT